LVVYSWSFFLQLALLGLVCRPSPKKPAPMGGQRRLPSGGTASGPRRKKRAGEDDRAKTGSRKQKDLKHEKPKNGTSTVTHTPPSGGGAGACGGNGQALMIERRISPTISAARAELAGFILRQNHSEKD